MEYSTGWGRVEYSTGWGGWSTAQDGEGGVQYRKGEGGVQYSAYKIVETFVIALTFLSLQRCCALS